MQYKARDTAITASYTTYQRLLLLCCLLALVAARGRLFRPKPVFAVTPLATIFCSIPSCTGANCAICEEFVFGNMNRGGSNVPATFLVHFNCFSGVLFQSGWG